MPRLVLISKVAVALGVSEHHLRKLCDQKHVPHQRVGAYRVFAADDLPAIRAACVRAGYLPATATEQEAADAV